MNLRFMKVTAFTALLCISPLAQADLTVYSQDFEGLVMDDPDALSNEGWKIFGNVFDSGGNYLFGYGVFGAPNGGSGFSAIATGEGGASQGAQQLSIYSDYNCCQPSNGHFNGTDLVESNVFQEQVIGPADVGSTWEFSFEAKRGNIEGTTTAIAFIKTLDPNAGFAVTRFETIDMTNVTLSWTGGVIPLEITADIEGHILQIGFSSTASNFQGSGVFYDNLLFAPQGFVDSDGDGVGDDVDNCTNVANPGQLDTNGDGYGNICDADLNNDCSVNFVDLTIMKGAFFSTNPDANLDGVGLVNFADLTIMKSQFFGSPGPSEVGNCP
ncbi:MAG: hypothetical protein HKN49_09385 [Gammaproteobacteria bacterium]|nr:hypothetical protein [Gammaproteobacteria bacterium]